jgi:hypothetical protein
MYTWVYYDLLPPVHCKVRTYLQRKKSCWYTPCYDTHTKPGRHVPHVFLRFVYLSRLGFYLFCPARGQCQAVATPSEQLPSFLTR